MPWISPSRCQGRCCVRPGIPLHKTVARRGATKMVAKVHMFTSTPGEMDTNSFLIETAASVVAIDTQFLGTPARQFRAMLDAIDKPLRAVVITHPHPDHFNGNVVFLEGLTDIPIL